VALFVFNVSKSGTFVDTENQVLFMEDEPTLKLVQLVGMSGLYFPYVSSIAGLRIHRFLLDAALCASSILVLRSPGMYLVLHPSFCVFYFNHFLGGYFYLYQNSYAPNL